MAAAEDIEHAQPMVEGAEPLHIPHSVKQECQHAHSGTTAAPSLSCQHPHTPEQLPQPSLPAPGSWGSTEVQ